MKLNSIMAAVIATSALGCGDQTVPSAYPSAPDICSELGMECTGDMICGETACEEAFPRQYRARLSVYSPTPARKCEELFDCPVPPVKVYDDDRAEPILDSWEPGAASIELDADSSLVIEIDGEACMVPMTAELLRSAPASCTKHAVTARVSLSPMPLDAER